MAIFNGKLGELVPTFFRLNGLLQAVTPAAALHGPPRELVHHHDLRLAHEVLTFPDVELFGSQGIHNLGAGRCLGYVLDLKSLSLSLYLYLYPSIHPSTYMCVIYYIYISWRLCRS